LVRFNLGGNVKPKISPYVISKVNKQQKIEHHRVYHWKDNTGFSIQISTQRKDISDHLGAKGDITDLIKLLKDKDILSKRGGVPGQKYKRLFENENGRSMYLEEDCYSGSTPESSEES